MVLLLSYHSGPAAQSSAALHRMGKCKKEAQTMRYRPGAHRSFRPRHRHWLRGLVLAVLVLAVLFLLYGCAVQRLIYSSGGQ